MDLWSPQEQQQQQHEFPVNRLYECKPVKRTKKYVLTPAQKKQVSLNSKQYCIFPFSQVTLCISNQKVPSFIANKNVKAQQQSQNRSLELLLNQ